MDLIVSVFAFSKANKWFSNYLIIIKNKNYKKVLKIRLKFVFNKCNIYFLFYRKIYRQIEYSIFFINPFWNVQQRTGTIVTTVTIITDNCPLALLNSCKIHRPAKTKTLLSSNCNSNRLFKHIGDVKYIEHHHYI